MKQEKSSVAPSPEPKETIPDTPKSFSFPSSIKLRLKLLTSDEMKPFHQLVQQIRDEHQSREVKNREYKIRSI